MFEKQTDSGVSPVIGVILMVAVTVALVALVTVVVFDIGGDVSESPDSTVQLSENSGEMEATLVANENVDYLYLKSGSATWGNESAQADATASGFADQMENAGDSISTSSDSDQSSVSGGSVDSDPNSGSPSSSDTVQVIAVMPDGSSEVLTTKTLD